MVNLSAKDSCDQPGLMPVDEAIHTICSAIDPVDSIRIPLYKASGYVLAEDIVASINVPPADNSSMDGYAIKYSDLNQGCNFTVSQRITAGSAPQTLEPGSCARIFTGAEIPAGADTVIMQEKVSVLDSGEVQLPSPAEIQPGDNIRRKGQDITSGNVLLTQGTRLDATCLGLIASVGLAEIEVYRKPVVTLLSTGDELAEPGTTLQAGQIYNSNRYMLAALFQSLGCEVIDGGIIKDTFEATQQALSDAAEDADLVITSGGVSVGEEDHVKPAVEALGSLNLWRMAMKPGKPLAFGSITRRNNTGKAWFTGLPGNPVSALLTALIVVRPALARMQGRGTVQPDTFSAQASFTFRTGLRREYLRVRRTTEEVDQTTRLERFANQNSGVLTSCHWADALAIVEPGQQIQEGDQLNCLDLKSLLTAP